MDLGSRAVGVGKLKSCCAALELDVAPSHCAADDALAAAAVIASCRTADAPMVREWFARQRPPVAAWPDVAASGRRARRERGRPPRRETYIGALLERLPDASLATDTAEHAYIDVLERVLEDRVMTADEAAALAEVAGEWGIGRAACLGLHDRYMRALAGEALRDGIVTPAERADLGDVAAVLGIGPELLEPMLDAPFADGLAGRRVISQHRFAGQTVCFTGQLTCTIDGEQTTRETAERLAVDHGMLVKSTVSRGLDMLVVADPDTQSGKARKAREYGTRLVAERAFWPALGVAVD
jgi:DNA polymerase-3 subunit epsilon